MSNYSPDRWVVVKIVTPKERLYKVFASWSGRYTGGDSWKMTGKLGRLTPGALADVLIVDGDPTRDVSCLLGQGDHIPLVMKEGVIYVNRL